MKLIKTLEPNTEGRDFVIGDLHGSFSLLTNFLEYINFNETKDRVVSVGDLVDRGPQNLECLNLLFEPWFHSVFGNHEELMVAFMNKEPLGNWWFRNGGGWWQHLNLTEQNQIIDICATKVDNLPFVITVKQPNGTRFHVLHAEIYSKVTDKDLEDETSAVVRGMLADYCSDGQAVIWGRAMFRALYNQLPTERDIAKLKRGMEMHKVLDIFSDELSPIFSGHTIMRKPTTIGGQTNIDTGAFFSAAGKDTDNVFGLTITEPLTGKFWLSNASSVKEVLPLVI